MDETKQTKADGTHTCIYRGTLPAGLGLLVLAPALLVFMSVAAAALAGGTLAALVLPALLRRRGTRGDDGDAITLDRDQYSRIDADPRQLPRR